MNRFMHVEPRTSFGRQIYVDFHIPQWKEEKIYVCLGINPLEFIFEFFGRTFWFYQGMGSWIE